MLNILLNLLKVLSEAYVKAIDSLCGIKIESRERPNDRAFLLFNYFGSCLFRVKEF